jgi:hypothetical protein
LFVSDELPGTLLLYSINDLRWEQNCSQLSPDHISSESLPKGHLALDLEGISTLADGRVVVLSERLRGLVTADGLVAQYDDPLGEMGNAGLEGVAVRYGSDGRSEIAVLWEGGYLENERLPPVFGELKAPRAVAPFVVAHYLDKGEKGLDYKSRRTRAARVIEVSRPPGTEPAAQRFRAPDLVWYDQAGVNPSSAGRSAFILLLNSRAAAKALKLSVHEEARRSSLWLQRFSREGAQIGKPLDIDRAVPERFQGLNWEGLAWWEEGKTLILVDDVGLLRPATQPPVVCRIDLPIEWQTSTPR